MLSIVMPCTRQHAHSVINYISHKLYYKANGFTTVQATHEYTAQLTSQIQKKKEKQSKQKYTAKVPLNTYVYGTLYIIAGRRKS